MKATYLICPVLMLVFWAGCVTPQARLNQSQPTLPPGHHAQSFERMVTKTVSCLGINTPEELNNTFKLFLEKKFPKEEGYTIKNANSIRAGVTSRMVELKLININKMPTRL